MLINENELNSEVKKIEIDFKDKILEIRSGKANVSQVEKIYVDAYGSMVQLNSVGQVISEDAMNLKVSVWDKSVLQNVEKAIRNADIGGSITIDKDFIRIKFLPMTQEDRLKKVKELKDLTENFKIRIRQSRQKFMKQIDSLEGVSEDDQDMDKKLLQKLIDESIENIENLSNQKEKEILTT